VDANACYAVTSGQRAEIEMRKLYAGQRFDVEVTAELLERAIA
jgi:hypothetical protein